MVPPRKASPRKPHFANEVPETGDSCQGELRGTILTSPERACELSDGALANVARKTEQSRRLQQRAEAVIPGGVNSPVRAFRAVGGDPPFIIRGQGSRIWDADGNEYIDYVGSW